MILEMYKVLRTSASRILTLSRTVTSAAKSEGEKVLKQKLTEKFPLAKTITVEDIGGGCGDMYNVFIESPEFKGLSTVKQHQLVNNALKEEIKQMHGVRITTKPVKDDSSS